MQASSSRIRRPLDRLPRREPVMRVPAPVSGEPGLITVDATWGVIQPIELPGGVRTVGELEVIEHMEARRLLVDTRQPQHVALGTLPGAMAIPHQDVVDHLDGAEAPIVVFCNGPQCTASPQAIAALLEAGWDPGDLRYYRGGIHDWVTLGLPLAEAVSSRHRP